MSEEFEQGEHPEQTQDGNGRTSLPLPATGRLIAQAQAEMGRVICGQRDAVEEVLMAVLCQGHALL
ncbi:MAG TPA: hypothetical protein VMV57_14430, partial [Terracidiphilus sp.]|nr:hypothetical protein [Terracidiphilus sp.]